MREEDIRKLVDAIDAVDFKEFWWNSPLLKQCELARDPRIAKGLLIRHHCLQNKAADSCHVIRNTIKVLDGPQFQTVWSFIDEEKNSDKLIRDIDEPYSLPWAAAYVLGEIGGQPALSVVTGKLNSKEAGRQYLFVRMALHLIARYMRILNQDEPSVESIDVKTGEKAVIPTRDVAADILERQLLRRKQADEYFTELDPDMLHYLKRNLLRIPEQLFPPEQKEILIQYVDYLPTLEG